ncbi:MAG: FG-GAP-like repeat-containing protein, partial [Roseimicrobium sp.]
MSLLSPTSPLRTDPRYPFAALLTFYAVLGCTTLGFNRSPLQIILTVAAGCALEMIFARLFRESSRYAPLSAYISSCGLGLLLNYSHNLWLLLPPVFVMVASKYLLTFNGRHVYNPSMFAVVMALLVGGDLYAPAPAYQWGHWIGLPVFIITAALTLFIFRVQRQWLVGAFLVFYLIQTCLRAWLLRHHLPPVTLLYGTFSAPSLYLFTFFMITDPRTSPEGRRSQILIALGLVTLDFIFHWRRSYETLFYSAFTLATGRFLYLHGRRLIQTRGKALALLLSPKWLQRAGFIAVMLAAGFFLFHSWIFRAPTVSETGFTLTRVEPAQSGLQSEPGTVLEEIDPRVRHIAKWLLSVGDAVAVADFDNDGLQDLFLTNPVKRPQDRNALYRNVGGLRFERVPLPALDEVSQHPETHGLSAGAAFADYDDDGDQDLLVTTGYGPCRLLRNELAPSGKVSFIDVSREAGMSEHSVSLAATFFDANKDGILDLLICNSFTPYLRDYDRPVPFNIFKLPDAEYEGDRRMFHFMHQGWHDAANGGENHLYLGTREGRFVKQDSKTWGLEGARWSLAVGTSDVNGDGYADLYIANDFGPDDFYMNEGGKRFRKIIGSHFGSIGRDTYKGMNVSIADLRNTG